MSNGRDECFRLLENVIFLKKSALFSGMDTAEVRSIAQIAEEFAVAAGDTVVRENDIGDAMYVIKAGEVQVVKGLAEGACVTLASLSAGDCFGDMSVFDAEMRSASVVAQTDCSLLKIGSNEIMDVIQENPSIAVELLKIFIQRLRAANQRISQAHAGRGV